VLIVPPARGRRRGPVRRQIVAAKEIAAGRTGGGSHRASGNRLFGAIAPGEQARRRKRRRTRPHPRIATGRVAVPARPDSVLQWTTARATTGRENGNVREGCEK